jgi:hypothetical protein
VDEPRTVQRRLDGNDDSPPSTARFDIVRPGRVLTQSNLDMLQHYMDQAQSGYVSAFAICAIGPSLATHRGWSGGMTSAERFNLMGQLQLLLAELSAAELEEDRRLGR